MSVLEHNKVTAAVNELYDSKVEQLKAAEEFYHELTGIYGAAMIEPLQRCIRHDNQRTGKKFAIKLYSVIPTDRDTLMVDESGLVVLDRIFDRTVRKFNKSDLIKAPEGFGRTHRTMACGFRT
jgi:hypothetical protein